MAKRKLSSKRGQVVLPPRAGFTYGYQWRGARHQPPPELKFPMDFGAVHLFPVVKKGKVEVIPHFPKGEGAKWHPSSPLDRLIPQYETGTFDHVDLERVAVAIDWHQEHGYDLNPFHLSGKSWGAVAFMRSEGWTNPINWMDTLVEFWDRSTNSANPLKWKNAPEDLWWLDKVIVDLQDWQELRNELESPATRVIYEVHSLDEWGNAYDGYTTNDERRAGTIEVPEDADHRTILRAMVDAGHLRPQAIDECTIDEFGDNLDILDSVVNTEIIPYTEEMHEELLQEDAGAPLGPVRLSHNKGSDVWAWAYNETLAGRFGPEGDPTAREQGRYDVTPDDIVREFGFRGVEDQGRAEAALAIARESVRQHVAALRDSTSQIPIYRLYFVDSFEAGGHGLTDPDWNPNETDGGNNDTE